MHPNSLEVSSNLLRQLHWRTQVAQRVSSPTPSLVHIESGLNLSLGTWQSFTWLSEVWWHNALQWGPSPARECGQTWNGLNKDQDQDIKILFLRATSSFSLQYSVIKATTWGRDRCFSQKLRKGCERNILHCTALQYISHLLVMKFCKGKIICSRNPHIRAEDPGQVHFFWTL